MAIQNNNKRGRPEIFPPKPVDLPDPVPNVPVRGRGRPRTAVLAMSTAADPNAQTAWHQYAKLAENFRKHQCREFATMGGGKCGAAASSMIASASLQLAASRWIFDQATRTLDPTLMLTASKLANDSRQNLLAAYEMVVREAKVLEMHEKQSPHVKLVEALNDPLPDPDPEPEPDGSSG